MPRKAALGLTLALFLIKSSQANQRRFPCPELWFPQRRNHGFLGQEYSKKEIAIGNAIYCVVTFLLCIIMIVVFYNKVNVEEDVMVGLLSQVTPVGSVYSMDQTIHTGNEFAGIVALLIPTIQEVQKDINLVQYIVFNIIFGIYNRDIFGREHDLYIYGSCSLSDNLQYCTGNPENG